MKEAMTRGEAKAAVAKFSEHYGNLTGVSYFEALMLLGKERLDRLLGDSIRCLGPTPTTIYPWNVADYLQFPDLGKQ